MKKTSKRTSASRKRSPAPRRAPYESALRGFADLAKRLGIRWYVFGAQAVNIHGYPRTTADLDLTIELGELSPQKLVRELDRAGFAARFSDDEFITATRVIPVVHRATKLPIDLVLAGPGLEQRFLDEVVLHPLANRSIPVLSAENLIVAKVLAGREKDLEDVRELLARRKDIDSRRIVDLLELLDEALERSDLVALYRRLRG